MEEKASPQPANINNQAGSKVVKPASKKGGNPLVSIIVWILGMFALIVGLDIISNLFGPGGPFFNR